MENREWTMLGTNRVQCRNIWNPIWAIKRSLTLKSTPNFGMHSGTYTTRIGTTLSEWPNSTTRVPCPTCCCPGPRWSSKGPIIRGSRRWCYVVTNPNSSSNNIRYNIVIIQSDSLHAYRSTTIYHIMQNIVQILGREFRFVIDMDDDVFNGII